MSITNLMSLSSLISIVCPKDIGPYSLNLVSLKKICTLTHSQVCTQVAPSPNVLNTSLLGSSILSTDDFDLLQAPADLKWAPAINKKTKNNKKQQKKKKQNEEQKKHKKARAHTQTHAHMYISCCI